MDESRKDQMGMVNQGWSSSKLVATVVLVPAVPMLLLSIASLGLFYLAPVRFGELINRLPGESVIRTALVFAPATLFAIVVLAVLYAVEQPVEAREGVRVYLQQTAVGDLLKLSSQWLLAPAALAAIISLGLWALSFVSPGRYDRLLAPLPGDSYWKPLVPLLPWLLFPLTLIFAYLAFSPTTISEDSRSLGTGSKRRRSLLDTAVSTLLAFALPSMLASFAALVVYRLRPERVGAILERLPLDSLIRLILLFAPPTLLSVVILAVLFLLGSRRERVGQAQGLQVDEQQGGAASWRASLATGVLVVGLSLSAFVGLGGAGALLYLLLR